MMLLILILFCALSLTLAVQQVVEVDRIDRVIFAFMGMKGLFIALLVQMDFIL